MIQKMRVAFKACLLAALLAVSTASPAHADSDDNYVWTGPYAGVHGGFALGQGDFVDREYNGDLANGYPNVYWDTDAYGPLGGVHAGYNLQWGPAVFGLEGEAGYLHLRGAAIQPGVDPMNIPYDAHGRFSPGWYSGMAVRLGVARDRQLFFAKAGGLYSTADIVFQDSCSAPAPCGNSVIKGSSPIGWGYQLGAGIEYALGEGDTWTFRTEYDYLDFGEYTLRGLTRGGTNNGVVSGAEAEFTLQMLRFSLGYRF